MTTKQPSYRDISGVKLQILPDPTAVAMAAARQVRARASAAIAVTGRFTIALSGGNTPKALFAELRKEDGLNWAKVHLFWGDERCVPASDSRSNYRLAMDHLLSHVPVPEANIHRVKTELGAKAAADAYAGELQAYFQLAPGAWPRFDMILLGMGEDGHTASLFPQSKALRDREHLVVSHTVATLGVERITMTYPVINAAAWVIVPICGEDKSATVKAVLETAPQPEQLPMQGVQPLHGQLLWLVDQAAASAL